MRRVLALCSAAVVVLGLVLPTTSAAASSRVVASSPAAAARAAQAAAPTVTSVTGAARGSGPSSGGTVTLRGTGFAAGATVTFGTASGTGVRVKSSTTLTVVAPARFPSTVDVRVTTAAGTSAATQTSRYTYVPAPVRNLVFTRASTDSVSLAWGNPVDSPGFSAVVVRRAVGAVPPKTAASGVRVAMTATAVTTATDSGLVPNTTYSYAVFAKAGVYAPAATLTVTTPTTGSISTATLPTLSDAVYDDAGGALLCPARGWCLSAGAYGRRDGAGVASRILSDGVWTATSFGPTSKFADSDLFVNDVACRERGACFASISVDRYTTEELTSETGLWSLDGSTWSAVRTPRPAAAAAGAEVALFEIDCPTSTGCVALGAYEGSDGGYHSYLATWSADTWTTRTLPDRSVNGNRVWPWDLTCRNASSCIADGLAFDPDYWEAGDGWENGSSSALRSRSRAHAAITRARGAEVADRVMGTRTAGGGVAAPDGDRDRDQAPAEPSRNRAPMAQDDDLDVPTIVLFRLESSSWTVGPLPLPATAQIDYVEYPTLACARAYCLALTSYPDSRDRYRTLSLTTGAAGWIAREPIPFSAPTQEFAWVGGVDCVDDTCTLTGGRGGWDTVTPIAASTTGAAWTRTAVAVPHGGPSGQSSLGAIGCRTATSCLAVGEQFSYDGKDDLHSVALMAPLEKRSGTAVEAPLPAAAPRFGADGTLGRVSCQPGGTCLATGDAGSVLGSGSTVPFVLMVDPGSGR